MRPINYNPETNQATSMVFEGRRDAVVGIALFDHWSTYTGCGDESLRVIREGLRRALVTDADYEVDFHNSQGFIRCLEIQAKRQSGGIGEAAREMIEQVKAVQERQISTPA